MTICCRNLKILLLLSFIYLIPFSVYSQENSIKLYSDFLVRSRQIPRYFSNDVDNFHYNGISFAYRTIRKNGLHHQIGLGFDYDNVEDAHKRIYAALRYEIGGAIKKKVFKIIKIGFGKSFRLYYSDEKVLPEGSRIYDIDINQVGIISTVYMNVEVPLGKRFYFELNTSVFGANFAVDYQYTNDPARTERQRKTGGFDFNLWSEKLLRLGIGINL